MTDDELQAVIDGGLTIDELRALIGICHTGAADSGRYALETTTKLWDAKGAAVRAASYLRAAKTLAGALNMMDAFGEP